MPLHYIQEKERDSSLPYVKEKDQKKLNSLLEAGSDFTLLSSLESLKKISSQINDQNIYVIVKEKKKKFPNFEAFFKKKETEHKTITKQSLNFSRASRCLNASFLPNFNEKVKQESSFQDFLFSLIRDKNLSDVEVYRRSNIDRRLFSKIRSDNYKPSKKSILALCVGLQLTLPQADTLLMKAGYSFSDNDVSDVIIQYCLVERIYDIIDVNEILLSYQQELL